MCPGNHGFGRFGPKADAKRTRRAGRFGRAWVDGRAWMDEQRAAAAAGEAMRAGAWVGVISSLYRTKLKHQAFPATPTAGPPDGDAFSWTAERGGCSALTVSPHRNAESGIPAKRGRMRMPWLKRSRAGRRRGATSARAMRKAVASDRLCRSCQVVSTGGGRGGRFGHVPSRSAVRRRIGRRAHKWFRQAAQHGHEEAK